MRPFEFLPSEEDRPILKYMRRAHKNLRYQEIAAMEICMYGKAFTHRGGNVITREGKNPMTVWDYEVTTDVARRWMCAHADLPGGYDEAWWQAFALPVAPRRTDAAAFIGGMPYPDRYEIKPAPGS